MPKYSIILPVRNGGEYVKECIHSLLRQSLSDFNIIVLDSGSNDGTVEWIRSLNNDKIIFIGSAEGLTIEKNWERIKDVSKNEFMTMIGHDDLLHPRYLQAVDDLIQQHPYASLYQTHFDYIDAKGDFVRNCLPMHEKEYAHDFLALQMQRMIDSTGTGYMMRSADFDSVGGMPVQYPNLIFSDYQLWMSLMIKGYKATLPLKLFSYRLHESLSKRTNGMAYQEAFCTYIEFLLRLMKNDPEINKVVQLHGKEFLLYYCEALSHRLLKTPKKERSLTVSGFIKKCKTLAAEFIPDQDFKPMKKIRIRIAAVLDNSGAGRKSFQWYKKL